MNTEEKKPIDWNKVKFRASSWGSLMTEPKTKEEKLAGKLSITTQKELIKIYNILKYGRKKDIVTNKMDKGKQAEEESITLFSRVEKKLFEKNLIQLENEWFCGHPDIYTGGINIYAAQEVWDIKTRWELDSFMPKLVEDADKDEQYQLQCYFSLTGAQRGGIANTLVDCPINILMDEKRRLLYSMNVVSEESPEYLQAAAELERLLTFPDIDYRERVIKQPVTRDDEMIEKMKDKVPVFRDWLYHFERTHMNQYPKQ
jgi:hypothetical protein